MNVTSGSHILTIEPSGASTTLGAINYPSARMEMVSLVDTPTTAANWKSVGTSYVVESTFTNVSQPGGGGAAMTTLNLIAGKYLLSCKAGGSTGLTFGGVCCGALAAPPTASCVAQYNQFSQSNFDGSWGDYWEVSNVYVTPATTTTYYMNISGDASSTGFSGVFTALRLP